MKISRTKGASLAALALAIAAGAGVAQDRPESILPPGFNEPLPTPTPTPRPTDAPDAPPPATLEPRPGAPVLTGLLTPTPSPTGTPTPIDLTQYELPDFAKRGLDVVGVATEAGTLPVGAFGTASGRTLTTLMRRLDAPLPSRWLSIAMRRMLMAPLATPQGVNGADFAAERAWLLLRMGEADAARWVVESVDVEDYTPKLFQVAMQAMLATADPGGLCPLVTPASRVLREPGWSLAEAMCAGLSGEPVRAGQLLDGARRRTGRGIDYLLAEKVVGAGAQGRRAVTIEWDGVDALTAWRYGLATATGVEIPQALTATTAPWVLGWRATAPMLAAPARVALSDFAAAQGILSNLALVDLYGEVEAADDDDTPQLALARDLRSAFVEGGADQRLTTLKRIWDGAEGRRARYARMVLTARAAARIAPSEERAAEVDRLIAAMLSSGLDRPALRWSGLVANGSDGWAMLALADPTRRAVSSGDVGGYDGGAAKQRLLFAGLAGLGRLAVEDAEALAQDLDVRVGLDNGWTRAITAAARRGEPATVLLLAAVGMQTPDWRGVPPEVLYHATAALRAVGLEGEARMIAAEAIARA